MTQLEKAREEIRIRTRLIDAEFEIFGNNIPTKCDKCNGTGIIRASDGDCYVCYVCVSPVPFNRP